MNELRTLNEPPEVASERGSLRRVGFAGLSSPLSISFMLAIGLAIGAVDGCVKHPADELVTLVPEAAAAVEPLPEAITEVEVVAEPTPPRPTYWAPPLEPVLDGVDGAGQLLARADHQGALDQLAQLEADQPPQPESHEWFVAGAIAGRAHLRLGQLEQAVHALEPIAASKQFAKHLPEDLVGYELARARIAWAKSGQLDREAADHQLELAVDELGHLRSIKPDRIVAPIRVAQGEAMAAIQGADERSRKRAAAAADKALERLITSFPNHPELGTWMLERALAKERAGKPKDAAVMLRAIHIQRAGEPEAERAWTELERLAAAQDKTVQPLSVRERLDAGQAARVLRRIDRSRELLEPLWQDQGQPSFIRREAGHSLAWTLYKQLDFSACVDVYRELYADVPSIQTREDLTRCLERGGRYDEAIDLWVGVFEASKNAYGATALWKAIELAVDGGRYQRASELLATFEAKYKSRGSERRWLHAWLPLRLGQHEQARLALTEMVESRRTSGHERAARYFLGKLELASGDGELRSRGVQRLRELSDDADRELGSRGVVGGFPLYYGLLARQRLSEAGEQLPDPPSLEPLEWESRWIGHGETLTLLRQANQQFGEAFVSLTRAEQLYSIGWFDEATRELRRAGDEYTTARGGDLSGIRSESLVAGLSWAPEWNNPKASASRDARKLLRDADQRQTFEALLQQLTWAMYEPYHFAKLSESDAAYRARWHLRAYRGPIERYAWEREVDPHHLWALMYTESRFRRHVVSHVGARGALQIMPWTGRQLVERLGELDEGERFDPDVLFEIETNSRLASYYIAELLAKFHGQPVFAYASYNGGPSNVARWLRAKSQGPTGIGLDEFVEEIPFSETANYARRVMEVHAAYELLYRGKLPTWTNQVDPACEDNIHF